MSLRQLLVGFIIASLILIVVFILVYSTGDTLFRTELRLEAGKSILQLIVIGLLGAIAGFLLDQYAREKEMRRAKRELQFKALNTLTTLYWQIRKAFFIIQAHQSAKSYGEQMQQITDYWIALKQLDNEVAGGVYGFRKNEDIAECLFKMDKLIRASLDEWVKCYIDIANLQDAYEKAYKDKPKDISKNEAAQEIRKLPRLSEILKDDFGLLHGLFEGAVKPIRAQLGEYTSPSFKE